jgi:hypothetical protein
MSQLLDDDLSKLSPEDLARVCRWVEDRMINAITPLDVRLQAHGLPGVMACDPVYQDAKKAVERIRTAVQEVRCLADASYLNAVKKSRPA